MPTVDLQETLDGLPLGRYHYLVAGLCAASVFMDGYDAQAMGFVAPALTKAWHIARPDLAPVLTASIVGMAVGALFFGPAADRIGRKTTLVFCTLWFGLCSVLTASATSPETMKLWRFITGIGLGGTLPNAIALTSEFMPKRLRATGTMLMFSGFSVGAAVGGLVAASIIGSRGWQGVFVVGGVLPCIVALALLALPESLRFRALKARDPKGVRAVLAKLGASVASDAEIKVTEVPTARFSVVELFDEGRARFTPLLWVMFFMSLLDLYFLNSWLPTVIGDAGIKQETAIVVTAMFQVGGSIGAWVLGRFFDSKASYRALALAYMGAAVSVFCIGFAGSSVALLTALVFVSGFFVIGGQSGSNSLAAESYPTAVRSTGVGWALGVGRIGSIVGPMAGGMLLTSTTSVRQVFWAAAIPPLFAMAAAWLVSAIRAPRVDLHATR